MTTIKTEGGAVKLRQIKREVKRIMQLKQLLKVVDRRELVAVYDAETLIYFDKIYNLMPIDEYMSNKKIESVRSAVKENGEPYIIVELID